MRLLICLFIMLFAFQANSEEQKAPANHAGVYHCQVVAKSGIEYSEQLRKWQSRTYDVESEDFLLKITDTGRMEQNQSGFKFRFYTVGLKKFTESETKVCWSRFTDNWGSEDMAFGLFDTLLCGNNDANYHFSFWTGRFTAEASGDYMSTIMPQTANDAAYIAAGKCQKVD
ncbi:hypothetical protein GOD58_18205 [Sinorhizobium medicae]|nr:hypothetical protein [Sinorhizobium medicae]MDX1016891.1 hypothetical protein [Sinorhizobium medicae]